MYLVESDKFQKDIAENANVYIVLLVHSTPGMKSWSPYLNFDPKLLNPVST